MRANHTVKIIGINMRSNRQLNNFQKHFDFTYLSFKLKLKHKIEEAFNQH